MCERVYTAAAAAAAVRFRVDGLKFSVSRVRAQMMLRLHALRVPSRVVVYVRVRGLVLRSIAHTCVAQRGG